MTYEQAVETAKRLGLKVRKQDQAWECWADRVEAAAVFGKPEHFEEANRYSGAR